MQLCKGTVKPNISAYVFTKPSFLSASITTICSGETVAINMDRSTDCYYYVQTTNGLEGYCMIPLIEKGE